MSPEEPIAALVADRLALRRDDDPPLVLGLCGAQGSGKSFVASRLAERFSGSAVLSLDDLYLTHAERRRLAHDVHPLFATRGVPGTHDVALGVETIAGVLDGKAVPLPRFDKAIDDRAPAATWPRAPQGCRLLVFEGWCIGAMPQRSTDLVDPINVLEAEEDRNGIWRCHVNQALALAYPALFALLDALVLLIPPDWSTVLRWRTEQEDALRSGGGGGAGVMDAARLARFVSHYERLTKHIWSEMPSRADLSLRLDVARRVTTLGRLPAGEP